MVRGVTMAKPTKKKPKPPAVTPPSVVINLQIQLRSLEELAAAMTIAGGGAELNLAELQAAIAKQKVATVAVQEAEAAAS
jgi:hypothetical protein